MLVDFLLPDPQSSRKRKAIDEGLVVVKIEGELSVKLETVVETIPEHGHTEDVKSVTESSASQFLGDSRGYCPICDKRLLNYISLQAHVERCLLNPASNVNAKVTVGKPVIKPKLTDIVPPSSTTIPAPAKILNISKAPPRISERPPVVEKVPTSSVETPGPVAKVGGKAKRPCPWYKLMTGTGFSVDAFAFGKIPACSAYFLTHFHADHYGGLTSTWNHGPIYCSATTARLVRLQLRVKEEFLVEMEMGVTEIEGVRVTLIPANHCPGAVLMLFDIPGLNSRSSRFLHTGDFRACVEQWSLPLLSEKKIDRLYLDTTYCKPVHTFPSQTHILNLVENLVIELEKGFSAQELVNGNPLKSFFTFRGPVKKKTLYVVGSYLIGKEKVFLRVAKTISGAKIYTIPRKRKIYDQLRMPELDNLLTSDPHSANVHVVPMNALNKEALEEMLVQFGGFERVIALRPTGWTYNSGAGGTEFKISQLKPVYLSDTITVIPIPYSEHSSYDELRSFVQNLEIDRIIPTVNLNKVKEMEGYFKSWKSSR